MTVPLADGLKTANNQNQLFLQGCCIYLSSAALTFTSRLLSISFSIISFRVEGETQAVKKKKRGYNKKEGNQEKQTRKVIKLNKEEKRPPTSQHVFSVSPPPACPSPLCRTILDHTCRPDSPEAAVTHRASL